MLSLTCMPNLQALSTFRTDLKRLDEKAALKINVFAVNEMACLFILFEWKFKNSKVAI